MPAFRKKRPTPSCSSPAGPVLSGTQQVSPIWVGRRMSWLSRLSQGGHGNYEFAPHFALHRGHYHEAYIPMTKDSDTPSLHERIQQLEAELNHLLEAQPQTQPGSELRQPASSVQATRLQYAMEASRDGLWDWDLQTGVVYCSHNYLRTSEERRVGTECCTRTSR